MFPRGGRLGLVWVGGFTPFFCLFFWLIFFSVFSSILPRLRPLWWGAGERCPCQAGPGPAVSLALPQDDVDDAAGQGQGEGQPRQDVGEAVGGVFRGLVPVRVPHCEDGSATHHAQPCGDSTATRQ